MDVKDIHALIKTKVNTSKAEGQKCPVCWKINKNGCERHSCFNKG